MAFVVRHTGESEETVVLRYAAVFYWLMWPTIAISILASVWPSTALTIITVAAWILVIASAAPYWPVVFELKRRMRDHGISASGSNVFVH